MKFSYEFVEVLDSDRRGSSRITRKIKLHFNDTKTKFNLELYPDEIEINCDDLNELNSKEFLESEIFSFNFPKSNISFDFKYNTLYIYLNIQQDYSFEMSVTKAFKKEFYKFLLFYLDNHCKYSSPRTSPKRATSSKLSPVATSSSPVATSPKRRGRPKKNA